MPGVPVLPLHIGDEGLRLPDGACGSHMRDKAGLLSLNFRLAALVNNLHKIIFFLI